MLLRHNRTDRYYVQTLKAERMPASGDRITVRDFDGTRVTAIVRSFQALARSSARHDVYAVEADESDGAEGENGAKAAW
jgi:hypothetical protein